MTSLESESERHKREYPKRNVAIVGLYNEDGQMLFTRAARLSQSWHAIGGGIEPGDKTPEAAAVREAKEELGVQLNPNELEFIITAPYDFGEGSVHCYLAPLSRTVRLQIDRTEIIEHAWLPIREAKKLPIFPALRAFLTELEKVKPELS